MRFLTAAILVLAAVALMRHREVNATYMGDEIHRVGSAHVAIAVAAPGGLVVPVIRYAERLTVPEIAALRADLVQRARDGKLSLDEMQGGTFTISNLGMFGIKNFDAVINPPHATILAVGAGEKRPVIGPSGQVEAATIMSCTLSCDHRVVDGAIGAELLNAFKQLMEDPVRMLV